MESGSHQRIEWYRESYLILSLCHLSWESQAIRNWLSGISPSRLGGAEKRRVESTGKLLAYACFLPWHLFGVLKEQLGREQAMVPDGTTRVGHRMRAKGPDPSHRRLNPRASRRVNWQACTSDVVFGVKSRWNPPNLTTIGLRDPILAKAIGWIAIQSAVNFQA